MDEYEVDNYSYYNAMDPYEVDNYSYYDNSDFNWDDFYNSTTSGLGTSGSDTSWLDDFASGYSTDFDVTEIANPALPGQEGYGWKYYSDGTVVSPSGAYYYDGEKVWSPDGSGVTGFLKNIGGSAANALMSAFRKPASQGGGVDWGKIGALGGGLAGLMGLNKPEIQKTGYQGGIPKYTAIQEQAANSAYDPNRRPGSMGQRYFTQLAYAKPGEEEAKRAAAVTAAAALNQPPQAAPEPAPVAPVEETQNLNVGGIAGLAKGGRRPNPPRYLRGGTDGMEDKVAASIENKQPAKLSHGEFVIPADVVSHLGNGNSDAGAKKLYGMMDRIRMARTGTKKQGKQINPDKFMPK